MFDTVVSSAFFGVVVSLSAYFVGLSIRKKTGLAVMNPILLAVALVIALLSALDIDYEVYQQSSNMLSALLTPATICLSFPSPKSFQIFDTETVNFCHFAILLYL